MSSIIGDGIKEDIYYLLWKKETPFKESLAINLPDTVFFKKGAPMHWYFTNEQGRVMRKRQVNTTNQNIINNFTKRAGSNDIVAYFITIEDHEYRERALNKNSSWDNNFISPKPKDQEVTHATEYFTAATLTEVLSKKDGFKSLSGVLQKFIQPYTSSNELIKAVWAPQMCVFTRRVNLHKFNDTKHDVYERAITFDGPDYYSKSVPLRGKNFPDKIKEHCESIVKHIACVSYTAININRMACYFKIDPNEKVWFLWATSIRVDVPPNKAKGRLRAPLDLGQCIKITDEIPEFSTQQDRKTIDTWRKISCAVCTNKTIKNSLVTAEYGMLIRNEAIIKIDKARKDKKIEAENKNNEGRPKAYENIGIPQFIIDAYPNLTLDQYEELKSNQEFLFTTVKICEDCFLMATEDHLVSATYDRVKKSSSSDSSAPVSRRALLRAFTKKREQEQILPEINEEIPGSKTVTPAGKRPKSHRDLKLDANSVSIMSSKPTTAASTRSRQLGKSNSVLMGNHSFLGTSVLTSPRNIGGAQPPSPIKSRIRTNNNHHHNFEEPPFTPEGGESHRIFQFFNSQDTFQTIGEENRTHRPATAAVFKQELAEKFKKNFNTSRIGSFRPLSGTITPSEKDTFFAIPTYSISNQIDPRFIIDDDSGSHYSIAKILNSEALTKPQSKHESPLKHRRHISTGLLKSDHDGSRPQSSGYNLFNQSESKKRKVPKINIMGDVVPGDEVGVRQVKIVGGQVKGKPIRIASARVYPTNQRPSKLQ